MHFLRSLTPQIAEIFSAFLTQEQTDDGDLPLQLKEGHLTQASLLSSG